MKFRMLFALALMALAQPALAGSPTTNYGWSIQAVIANAVLKFQQASAPLPGAPAAVTAVPVAG
jgi:hypothetical protein